MVLVNWFYDQLVLLERFHHAIFSIYLGVITCIYIYIRIYGGARDLYYEERSNDFSDISGKIADIAIDSSIKNILRLLSYIAFIPIKRKKRIVVRQTRIPIQVKTTKTEQFVEEVHHKNWFVETSDRYIIYIYIYMHAYRYILVFVTIYQRILPILPSRLYTSIDLAV